MDANSNSDIAQDSEVVDDEPTVPVTLPDDNHDISGKASVVDTEKRRRLEDEDADEDDKSGDRHRRKKKKSKDREREHRDKDKDRDGRKREHRDKDREKDRDRGGRDRSDRDRDHDDGKSKRKSKSDDIEPTDDAAPRVRDETTDGGRHGKDKERTSSSSRSSKPTSSGGEAETANASVSKRDSHRDNDRDSKRSDRNGDREKDRGHDREKNADGKDREGREREGKDRDGKDREGRDREKDPKDKDKEKEKKSRRSRSRSPGRREAEDRERRDRERSKERNERRLRDREHEREKDRTRERERERDDRRYDRGGTYRRRDKSRSRSAERRRSEREKEREERAEKEKKEIEEGVKRITLKDILTANPGISIPDAVQRLNVYNTAAAMSAGPLDPSVASAALAGPSSSGPLGPMDFMGGFVDPSSAAMAAAQAVAALNAQVVGISGPFGVVGEGGAVTKPHREVYIGNLPPGVTVSQLADFLNAALKQLGVAKETGSVVSCWVSGDGHYGFAELRTVEECNAALAYLNGVQIGINLIKVGRPKGYLGPNGMPVAVAGMMPPGGLLGGMMNPVTGMMGLPTAPNPMMAGIGMLGGGSTESHSNVVMVSNLPMGITDDQVRELVSPFGTLTAFNSIKTSSGTTQAAVFEYADSAAADGAVSGLDKLEIADHKLSVQRVPAHAASLLLQPTSAPAAPPRPPPPAAREIDPLTLLPPTPVIRLSNMTTPAELASDEEYMELQEDVSEECNVYGSVCSVVIPRGGGDSDGEEVGMVYVHFTHSEGAAKAKQAIAGRMFNGNIVKATFYPEVLFTQQIYVVPPDYVLIPPKDTEETKAEADADADRAQSGETTEILAAAAPEELLD